MLETCEIIPNDVETSGDNIERIAIDQCGTIGSYYDAYRDKIVGRAGEQINTHNHILSQPMKCILVDGQALGCKNLLRFMDIDRQQRLSILLGLTNATGIASLINYPNIIDKNTRLLYICQESRREFITHNRRCWTNLLQSLNCISYATHVITEIIWGLHILVILQLPSHQAKSIDGVLHKLKYNLVNQQSIIQINSDESSLLEQIVTTTVYSNIDALTKCKKIEYIYENIKSLQGDYNLHGRLKYILSPIPCFLRLIIPFLSQLVLGESNEFKTLEHYLIQQKSELKLLKYHTNYRLRDLLQDKCATKLKKIQNQLTQVEYLHSANVEKFTSMVINIRQGHNDSLMIKVSLDPPPEIERLSKNIHIDIENLELKHKLIQELQSNQFEYCDVADLGIQGVLSDSEIDEIFLGNASRKVIFYSNDDYKNNHNSCWKDLYSQMLEKRKKNPYLCLVYVDFTYSECKLNKMRIAQLEGMIENQTGTNSQSIQSTSEMGTAALVMLTKAGSLNPVFIGDNIITSTNTLMNSSVTPSSTESVSKTQPTLKLLHMRLSSLHLQTQSSPTEYINILLLGESGVGKSTFINAFANYLRFQSLDEAEKKQSIVIIPVSFMLTINDNFDEKIIKFGEIDLNENHNDLGQSVTQHCKTYVFSISDRKKLRFIDTPGFGDTRGIDQDNLNMEEIFSFLDNIDYINGICLLFKPEVVQLNRYLRSCFMQLIDYFGNTIVENFIFCFTNARSTFFTPGNTLPLLKAFFKSFPDTKVIFEKKNTFCFDSEAFRYLVAIKDNIEFNTIERTEFEQSWKASVAESERFLKYLCDQSAYKRSDKWQSIKDAQLQIHSMIRPTLEAMRNILRNIILYDHNLSINIFAKPVTSLSMLCYKCGRNPEKINEFWIIKDHLHSSCNMCTPNELKQTEYRLGYEPVNHHADESIDQMNKYIDVLCKGCARLIQFLIKTSQVELNDPFLFGIEKIINEENFIYEQETSRDLNQQLIERLKQIKHQYQHFLDEIQSDENSSKIYQLIQKMIEIPMVKLQLDAIQIYHQILLKTNEKDVSINKT
ncbi:unnamed protein product [Rotaria sp. Silwood2]|nr:unnamed protein product [Rotaria sp. Silwood2]CAF4478590.1 unnamed protein product [Rotaria sp. Silwood2]